MWISFYYFTFSFHLGPFFSIFYFLLSYLKNWYLCITANKRTWACFYICWFLLLPPSTILVPFLDLQFSFSVIMNIFNIFLFVGLFFLIHRYTFYWSILSPLYLIFIAVFLAFVIFIWILFVWILPPTVFSIGFCCVKMSEDLRVWRYFLSSYIWISFGRI